MCQSIICARVSLPKCLNSKYYIFYNKIFYIKPFHYCISKTCTRKIPLKTCLCVPRIWVSGGFIIKTLENKIVEKNQIWFYKKVDFWYFYFKS